MSITLDELAELQQAATAYGLTTLAQAVAFMKYSAMAPLTSRDLRIELNDAEYKREIDLIRKLSGTGYRGHDGLGLFTTKPCSDHGKSTLIQLTPKGKRLAGKLGTLRSGKA